jgi:anion-transporting  ArsA/GET3 family ATPase
VNQLIKESPSAEELEKINNFLNIQKEAENSIIDPTILENIRHYTIFSYARRNIQEKYLKMLRETDEAKDVEIVEVPLLNLEVTGTNNLKQFAKLISGPSSSLKIPRKQKVENQKLETELELQNENNDL